MNQVKKPFGLKLIILGLLLTLHHQVVFSSITGKYLNRKISILPAGFLKVDNNTFILNIDREGKVQVSFDIESQRKAYLLQTGSDTFKLDIKLFMSDNTQTSFSTKTNTIQWGEKKHFYENFFLTKEQAQKVNECDICIDIVGTDEHWTTKNRKRICGCITCCTSSLIIIPSAILCTGNGKRRLLDDNNNFCCSGE